MASSKGETRLLLQLCDVAALVNTRFEPENQMAVHLSAATVVVVVVVVFVVIVVATSRRRCLRLCMGEEVEPVVIPPTAAMNRLDRHTSALFVHERSGPGTQPIQLP